MRNLTEIKNKIADYRFMSYQEYKNLREEIFSLDDDSISELYGTTMDSIDERETELMHLEREDAGNTNWYARTKYFNKLYSEVSDYMHDLFDKEMEKPIEQKIDKIMNKEALVKETSIPIRLRSYKVLIVNCSTGEFIFYFLY